MGFRVDIVGLIDEIIALLKTNITDLNQDLIKPFTDVDKQIINNLFYITPSYVSKYPFLFVYPLDKSETFSRLGVKGRKEIEQIFGITGITRIISDKAMDDNRDTYTMAENVDYIFRNNIKFSDKIILSNPQRTTFDLKPTGYSEGVYVSIFTAEIFTKLDIVGG